MRLRVLSIYEKLKYYVLAHMICYQQELQTARGHTEVMLTLALYREITCANLYPQKKRRVSENVSTRKMSENVSTRKMSKNISTRRKSEKLNTIRLSEKTERKCRVHM